MSMGRYAQQPLQVVYECFDQEGNNFDIFIFLNEHKQYSIIVFKHGYLFQFFMRKQQQLIQSQYSFFSWVGLQLFIYHGV